jgi:hypothetical protein
MKRAITAAAAVAVAALAACGGGAPAAHHAAASSKPAAAVARSYPDAPSLIAAMAVGGAICRGVRFHSGSAVPGAQSVFAGCSGSSNGDTTIEVFGMQSGAILAHANAVAYADRMVAVGTSLHSPTAEVIGPNWVVNTVPSFATEVVAAVHGTEKTSP